MTQFKSPDELRAEYEDRKRLEEQNDQALIMRVFDGFRSTGAPLIGVRGDMGAGKDTVGKFLVDDHGFTRFAFADALKCVAFDIGWDGVKDEAGRRLLQTLGVSIRENVAADAWIQALETAVEKAGLAFGRDKIVVTDVRFPNEVDFIRRHGGQVWLVRRPEGNSVAQGASTAANGHISERALDGLVPDWTLNNHGTIEDLRSSVDAVLRFPQ